MSESFNLNKHYGVAKVGNSARTAEAAAAKTTPRRDKCEDEENVKTEKP